MMKFVKKMILVVVVLLLILGMMVVLVYGGYGWDKEGDGYCGDCGECGIWKQFDLIVEQ